MDRPHPAVQSYRGASQGLALPAEMSEALRMLSRREGVTLFMTLLAAFQTLLHRYTEQDQISVGTPIANRNQAETEGLIGFFVNTLVLRTDLSGDPSFSEVLRRVREVCLGAYGHQDVPFEKLVEVMQPERSLNHSPLFQVWLALQNAPTTELSLKNLSLRQFRLQTTTTRFDLGLLVKDTAQGFSGVFEYNSDLFERDTIDRLLRLYETLLHSIVGQPESRLSVLEQILDDEERKQQSIKTKEFEEADKYMLKHIKRKPISRSLP
jgi:non-ribosomal peptide synthetase component F